MLSIINMDFPGGTSGKKNPPANAGDVTDMVQSMGGEDLLKEGMETHPSILACRIPWMEKPDRLQSMGSQRVGHD